MPACLWRQGCPDKNQTTGCIVAHPLVTPLLNIVLPAAAYVFYRLLAASWRISLEECPTFQQSLQAREPVILAHWHGDELALIHLVRRYRIATITSHSRDGERMNRLLRYLGAVTARGSSSRGGAAALRGVLAHCKRGGYNVSMAVDGPRGPIYRVKPGVFEFSRLLQAPIYAVSAGVSRPWIFQKAWNKAVLPGFFSHVHISIQPAMPALQREQDPRCPQLAGQLEAVLRQGREAQCQHMGRARP